MQTDRTTKTLLFAIALGLWVNVLGDWMRPRPAHAAPAATAGIQRMADVAADIALLSADIAALESSISSVESSINSVESDVSSLGSNVSSMRSSLSSMRSEISSIYSDVDDIEDGSCSNDKIC